MKKIIDEGFPVFTAGWPIRGARGYEEIVLGVKAPTEKAVKLGIAGKLMPYGGGVEPEDPSIVDAFVREFIAESDGMTVDPKDVEVVAKIKVRNTVKPTIILYLLFARNCKGEPNKTTREMANSGWINARPTPENVLESDKILLPRLLCGEKLVGWIKYDGGPDANGNALMKIIGHDFRSVDTIE